VKLSVILPAYNEAETIGQVLDALQSLDLSHMPQAVEKEIIVVDDASTDHTAEVARARPGVVFLRHERNRGKGEAIRTGLERATGDVVLMQDADLEYSVADYPAILRPFMEGAAEVVYGSRFLRRRWPKGMRISNWLGNRLLTLAANVLYGAGITDEATCLKAFRRELIKSLPLRARGFDFCPEVTALVRLRGATIAEVPVGYEARTVAEGKKVRWRDGVIALKTLLAYRLRRSAMAGGRGKGEARGHRREG